MIENIIKKLIKESQNYKNNSQNSKNNIDNQYLLYLIQHHQLSSLIYSLKETIQKMFPSINDQIINKCQAFYLKNLCNSMQYTDFLKQANLPKFYIVKGPVAATLFYSPEQLREYNDLDIFISVSDYGEWLDYLARHDFVRSGNVTDNFPAMLIKKYNFAQHFINQKEKIAIDLHFNISNKMHPFQFEMQDFFNNTRKVTIDGAEVNTFTTEYLIVYHLYHAFKHYYFKLAWFIDIYNLFTSQTFDENLLYYLINKYKLKNLFQFYLGISRDLFGDTGVPNSAKLLTKFKPKTNRYINANQVVKGEFDKNNSFMRLLLPLFYLPKIFQKFLYLEKQLFPPAEILPEFHNSNQHKNLITYLKLRLNRLNRI